ncbi:MAG: GntR family transcriptional regulator [Pseudonocardia sp.]
MTAEPLESSSLVDLAVRRLRGEILSGALRPGERLVEEQLTRRFGTSRAPLREALRLLGQQGLVEHLPRRGVRVVELSGRDIAELFGLRDVLEQYAVRRALADGPPADLSGLTAALERMAGATGDAVESAVAHREFHTALVALAGHHHLMRTYEPILLQLQLYMATNLRREAAQRAPQEAVARHRRLVDAVASGDVAAALAALDTHGARTYLAPELAP